ncbi:MAG: hypothetical protein R3C54_14135 [Parvularculaceae bacterium]
MTVFFTLLAVIFNIAGAGALYLSAPKQRLLGAPLPMRPTMLVGAAAMIVSFMLYRQVAGPAASVFILMTASMFFWTLPPLVIAWLDARRKPQS